MKDVMSLAAEILQLNLQLEFAPPIFSDAEWWLLEGCVSRLVLLQFLTIS